MSIVFDATAENIAIAAARLKEGGLVALPTETVYGLGADATNDRAVARIFEAKGRPTFNPLIVHFADVADVEKEVEMNDAARTFASLFWPGPLTMILPRRADANISLLCSAGLPTLAMRVPAHPVAMKLLSALYRPIAAPSANASGTLSPTTPQHVFDSLGTRAEMILAGGKSIVGLESTVVDLTQGKPVVLRMGVITPDDLKRYGGMDVGVETAPLDTAPKSPGQLLRHYAPKTPLRLKAVDVKRGEALLAFGSTRFMGVEGGGAAKDLPQGHILNLSETGDLHEAAANLFAMLHQLDRGGFKKIAVMDVPDTGFGLAINDRLRRAAGAQTSAQTQE